MIKTKTKLYVFTIFVLIILLAVQAVAQKGRGVSIIRDEETEKFLSEITAPIFRAVGLDETAIEIVIINDPSINAFVANGQKVFIHTGLIMESDDAASLIGVIAHEAGHIKGAHIIQKSQKFDDANIGMIAGYVLGLGSVVAGAPAEAGLAITSASQNIATRNVMTYSREFENSADSVAIDVLEQINISPAGLVKILRKLVMKQKISAEIVDKYLLTHPVSEDRINYILNYMKTHPEIDKKTPDNIEARFKRIRAKFYGFLAEPKKTRNMYLGKNSADARYALAIAYHQEARFDESDKFLQSLLQENPSDGYLQELKGQFLFERGRIAESISQYKKVSEMLPESNLVRLKLANAILATENEQEYPQAISVLKTIISRDPRNIGAINRLGIAYGKLGKLGTSYLYLAEAAIIAKDRENSKFYLAKAEKLIDKSSQEYLKFTELKKELGRLMED